MTITRRLGTGSPVQAALLILAGLAALPPSAQAQRAGDPVESAAVAPGVMLYLNNCANCHGDYGEGDGVVTASLNVVLQDLRYLSERNDGEFPADFVRQIIDGRETRASHGPPGMPVWGAEFLAREGYDEDAEGRVAERIDALVDFLESIQISEAAAE